MHSELGGIRSQVNRVQEDITQKLHAMDECDEF